MLIPGRASFFGEREVTARRRACAPRWVLAAPLSGLLWKETGARCGTREVFSVVGDGVATHPNDVGVAQGFGRVLRVGCVAPCSNMLFYDHTMPNAIDPDARRVALALLARGIIRPHEAAELAGVSLQVMNHWLRRSGVDWERMRRRVLGNAWRKEMKRGPRLVESEPTATELRHWE